MSTFIGPNGRIYRRRSHPGRWIAATIISVAVISAAILGLPLIADAFRFVGL
jgi:hypothetical protein